MVWLLRQREWRLQLQSMWSQRGSGNITSTLASPLFFCLYILKLTFYILIFSFPSHYKSQVTTMLTENPDLSIRVITSDSGGWLVHGENKSFNPKQRWESESWSQPIHTHIFLLAGPLAKRRRLQSCRPMLPADCFTLMVVNVRSASITWQPRDFAKSHNLCKWRMNEWLLTSNTYILFTSHYNKHTILYSK